VRDGNHRLSVRPWAFEGFLRRLLRYLGDGRLPWPRNTVPATVRLALDAYRQQRNRELEQAEYKVANTEGRVARKNDSRASALGLKSLPGEIDVIAIDPKLNKIWVIEVKDPYEPFSSAQLRYQIDDFHDDEGSSRYVAKLLRKTEAVAANPATVAARLRIPEPNRSWNVIPMMVMRHPAGSGVCRKFESQIRLAREPG
jgi:hypothetical protein